MIVDLNPLPFTLALKIIRWCFEHDIDRRQCCILIDAMQKKPVPDNVEWVLNIPEKYITWFTLVWSNDYETEISVVASPRA